MIILGIILLIIGLVAGIGILLWLGIALLVIGAILAVAGSTGHSFYGRRHYW